MWTMHFATWVICVVALSSGFSPSLAAPSESEGKWSLRKPFQGFSKRMDRNSAAHHVSSSPEFSTFLRRQSTVILPQPSPLTGHQPIGRPIHQVPAPSGQRVTVTTFRHPSSPLLAPSIAPAVLNNRPILQQPQAFLPAPAGRQQQQQLQFQLPAQRQQPQFQLPVQHQVITNSRPNTINTRPTLPIRQQTQVLPRPFVQQSQQQIVTSNKIPLGTKEGMVRPIPGELYRVVDAGLAESLIRQQGLPSNRGRPNQQKQQQPFLHRQQPLVRQQVYQQQQPQIYQQTLQQESDQRGPAEEVGLRVEVTRLRKPIVLPSANYIDNDGYTQQQGGYVGSDGILYADNKVDLNNNNLGNQISLPGGAKYSNSFGQSKSNFIDNSRTSYQQQPQQGLPKMFYLEKVLSKPEEDSYTKAIRYLQRYPATPTGGSRDDDTYELEDNNQFHDDQLLDTISKYQQTISRVNNNQQLLADQLTANVEQEDENVSNEFMDNHQTDGNMSLEDLPEGDELSRQSFGEQSSTTIPGRKADVELVVRYINFNRLERNRK